MYELPLTQEGAERVVASARLILPEAGQEIWLPTGDKLTKPDDAPPGFPYLVRGMGCGSHDLREIMRIADNKRSRRR